MISILATIDGSPASRAVLPVLEKLAANTGVQATLLTVVERPKATRRREVLIRAPYTGVAGPSGIEVTATRRSEPRYAENDDQALQRALSESHEFLEAAVKPFKDRGIEVSTQVVVDDDVAAAIVEVARRSNADFIAMATHGRGGLREVVQGSVASAVVRSGVAPVLLVRPTEK